MFHALPYYAAYVTRKTKKMTFDLTFFFSFVSYTVSDTGLQHVAYRLLGIHGGLPRAAEEVTKEEAIILPLSNGLHPSCKVYRDI